MRGSDGLEHGEEQEVGRVTWRPAPVQQKGSEIGATIGLFVSFDFHSLLMVTARIDTVVDGVARHEIFQCHVKGGGGTAVVMGG